MKSAGRVLTLAASLALVLVCSAPAGLLAAEHAIPSTYPSSRPVLRTEAAPAQKPAVKAEQPAPAAKPKAAAPAESKKPAEQSAPSAKAAAKAMSPDWKPLLEMLKKDGVHGKDIDGWYARLDSGYSEKPMGIKISSVFQYRYRPFKFLRKPQTSPNMLPGVFVPANVEKCAAFLRKYPKLFENTEKTYKVDKEIVASLLMVETKLGTYMGNEHAFWSLSCMALADKPAKTQKTLDKLYLNDERSAWVKETMKKRSEWAYKELVALIDYCRKYKHDPLAITGSPYGAIGLPQFMPSNIPAYAVDGNKDGKIDLFMYEDAVPSIANYIKAHGWKPGLKRSEQHRIIRRYNHSDMYANTVLALADGIKEYNKAAEARAKAETAKAEAGKTDAAKPASKAAPVTTTAPAAKAAPAQPKTSTPAKPAK